MSHCEVRLDAVRQGDVVRVRGGFARVECVVRFEGLNAEQGILQYTLNLI
jgi:hypothetical protein